MFRREAVEAAWRWAAAATTHAPALKGLASCLEALLAMSSVAVSSRLAPVDSAASQQLTTLLDATSDQLTADLNAAMDSLSWRTEEELAQWLSGRGIGDESLAKALFAQRLTSPSLILNADPAVILDICGIGKGAADSATAAVDAALRTESPTSNSQISSCHHLKAAVLQHQTSVKSLNRIHSALCPHRSALRYSGSGFDSSTGFVCLGCRVFLPSHLMRGCSRCGSKYCSRECQSADWKRGHKQLCPMISQPATGASVVFSAADIAAASTAALVATSAPVTGSGAALTATHPPLYSVQPPAVRARYRSLCSHSNGRHRATSSMRTLWLWCRPCAGQRSS